MKRAVGILIMGLVVAMAGYCALYYSATREQRQILESPAPELAWLKREFQLGGTEFERVAKLHEGYMPRCAEFCRRIAEKNSELQQLVASTNINSAAVEQKLQEAGELRVQCQQNMFKHFLEVSRQMPPAQGWRYLQWVGQRTLTPEHDMARRHDTDHKMDRH
jgi:hypothetical protein